MVIRTNDGRFASGSGRIDITGKRFGKLVVSEYAFTKQKRTYWKCICDCGTIKTIRGDCLSRICSCGCEKRKQDIRNLDITNNHKMSKHLAFNTWLGMIDRCKDKGNPHYKDYGGRGITVCEEWNDVRNFCKWADENGYRQGLTIERIDVNGNYDPSNCKLIPMREQALNRRDSVYVFCGGRKVYLAREAYELGIDYSKVKNRYKRGIRDYETLFYDGNLKDRYKWG